MDLPIIDIVFNDEIKFEVFGYGLVNKPAILADGVFLSEEELSDEILDSVIAKGELIDEKEYMLIHETPVVDESTYQINLSADDDSEQDNQYFKIRYEYAPNEVSENSRSFCKKLVGSNLLFRKEDLISSDMNAGFGPNGADSYNIFLYKGGVNCRHKWQRKIYLKKGNKEVSYYEALKKIGELDKKAQSNVKFQTNPKEVTEIASPDNNYWKLSIEDVGEIKLSSTEKRIVVAPLLIPDQKIKRSTPRGNVYIRFKKDVIQNIQRNFRKKGYGNAATLEHKVKIEGVNVVEDWIIDFEEMDKSRGYGFNHKAGTWMVMLSIENDEIWNDYVKTGKVKGLSIEGRYSE